MKLRDAMLCLDCDEVFSKQVYWNEVRCPKCGAKDGWPIEMWLNREQDIDITDPEIGRRRLAAVRAMLELQERTEREDEEIQYGLPIWEFLSR